MGTNFNVILFTLFLTGLLSVFSISYTQEITQQESIIDEEEVEAFEDAKTGGLLGYVKFLKEFPDSEYAPEVKIWLEIVKGNYEHYKDITFITKRVAESLLKQKVFDLKPNKVKSLTKETVSILAKWLGNEINLNGLRTLSVESAMALAKWKGEEIDLSGLKNVSAELENILKTFKWKVER